MPKLSVGAECPYFEDGHQVCELVCDDAGRVVGVHGPHQELYSRIIVENECSESTCTEVDASCMVEAVSVETFSDVSSEACKEEVTPPQPSMAAVVCSNLDVGRDRMMFEDAELRGDVTNEFRELLVQYPNVTQVYRLGCVAFSAGGNGNSIDVVSKIIVQNTGKLAWPDFSSIRSVVGPSHGLSEMMLGAVPAGDKVEIVLDLKINEGQGGRSSWAMCDQWGEPFGPVLLFEIIHI
jgi:hypothetical protein